MNINQNREGIQGNITNINSRLLDGSLNTKSDWYNHLKYSLGFHLPSYKKTSMRFIKDMLASRKELLKSTDVIYVNVPNYPELGVLKIFNYVKDNEVVNRYLGVYDGHKYLPDKHFFYGVLGTLKNEWLTQIVMSQQIQRNQHTDEEQLGETIEISQEFLKEIQSIPHFSKRKGKALSLHKQKSLGRKQPKNRKRYKISGYEEEQKQGNQFQQTQQNMQFRDENTIFKSPLGKRLQLY